MKKLYPVAIGGTTFLATPLPLPARTRPELGATVACPVNAMARRAYLPDGLNFGYALEHQPEFFTFWSGEIARAEWNRRGWWRRRVYQWWWLRREGANFVTAALGAMSMEFGCDPLAAAHEALADALNDPEKLRTLLNH